MKKSAILLIVLLLAFSTLAVRADGTGYADLLRSVDYGDQITYVIGHRSPDADTARLKSEENVIHLEQTVGGYSGFLFIDDNGLPIVAMHWEHRLSHMVNRYNSIYKVQIPKITPHVCRHTYCSNMARKGMNPKTLQYLMGHSDISVTLNVYTHLGLQDAVEEMTRL